MKKIKFFKIQILILLMVRCSLIFFLEFFVVISMVKNAIKNRLRSPPTF